MDLDDLEHNTKDGLHIASLAGAWTALVAGFGGMRIERGGISFRPQLPPGIMGLSFRLRYRGRMLHVEVRGGVAKYSVLSGPELDVRHYDDVVTVGDKAVSLEIPVCQPPPPPCPASRAHPANPPRPALARPVPASRRRQVPGPPRPGPPGARCRRAPCSPVGPVPLPRALRATRCRRVPLPRALRATRCRRVRPLHPMYRKFSVKLSVCEGFSTLQRGESFTTGKSFTLTIE